MSPEITISDVDVTEVPRLDQAVRPRRLADVGAVPVTSGGVIAGEHSTRPVWLDAVAWNLWAAMDGTYRIEEMALDLAWATSVGTDMARRQIGWLVKALAVDGFLAEPEPIDPVLPRRVHPNLPQESCLGRRLGLSRAQILEVTDNRGEPFLVGCTEPSILDQAVSHIACREVPELGRELVFLRATVARSGRDRLQQILDSLANPLFVGRDLDTATEAFARTIEARRQACDGVWSEGIALQRDDRALLIHPRFREEVAEELRAELGRRDITFVPSGFLRFDGTSAITVPAVPALGCDEIHLQLAAVLVPPSTAEHGGSLLSALPVARRWDQPHLEQFAMLCAAGVVQEHPVDGSPSDLMQAIEDLLARA